MTTRMRTHSTGFRLLQAMVMLSLVLSAVPFAARAQVAAKRPINHNDYDSWRSIQSQKLSADGKFLAYALIPEDGDGEIVVRNLASGTEWRQPVGHRPEVVAGGDGAEPVAAVTAGPAGLLSFTADGRNLVFTIYPLRADTEKAKRAKRTPAEMPKSGLGIMDLISGDVAKIERVRRFQVPEDGSGFIAYQLEAKPEERRPAVGNGGGQEGGAASEGAQNTGGQNAQGQNAQGAGRRPGGARGGANARPEFGTDLVLRNMTDKTERTFADVTDFSLSKDAKSLVYTVSTRKNETNGVYSVSTGSADAPTALVSGKGKYSRISWDDKQTQMAFLSDRDDTAASQPKYKIYHWVRDSKTAEPVVSVDTPNFRKGWIINDRANINFSQDGNDLYLGVSRPTEVEPEDDTPADEKVSVDLWHYKDDYIQPMQKVRAEQDRNRSYRAVLHLKDKKYVQLGDETMQDISPSTEGRFALGQDDRAYRTLVGYDTDYHDVYLVNTADGSKKPLLQKLQSNISWSPNGKYALFYDGKDWDAISVADGKTVNLTKNVGVSFFNETHDSPSTPPTYGQAGWTKDERYILLYDRYDIWQIAADGSSAKNMTSGRKEKMIYRYVNMDSEGTRGGRGGARGGGDRDGIDPAEPMLLRAENEWTRESGFYRLKFGSTPEKLIMQAKNFTTPTKAKNADVMMLTASTFSEFPDLLITNSDFKDLKKVSNANPQKDQMLWGTSELVRYKNADGQLLSAMLVKPANFDPSKKYPMLVYIYETLSENVNRFVDPAPRHTINASYYASNGYLVLMPDIVYKIGYPGQSALKCVLPAVQSIVDKGFVDENAIGIQGHSWGGYQIAYMVTQTNRFKAAAPGAVVANMTSAYSGIRWGTGIQRQFQYEHTQSRIGGNLWEYPMRFIENSPVFMADRVQTPLLMIHNDADDAVPWYQGIEYYLALRRLGKEVYMFSYNGEPHGLRRRPNQKDYTVRLQQYFDHFLKGAPMPDWMERGIPFLEKGKEKTAVKAAGDSRQQQ